MSSKKIKVLKEKRALSFPSVKEIGDYEDLLLNDLLGAPYKPLKDNALPHRDENPVVYFEVEAMGGTGTQTIHHITAHHSTAHHSTSQHSTAQHSTSHHLTSHHITSYTSQQQGESSLLQTV